MCLATDGIAVPPRDQDLGLGRGTWKVVGYESMLGLVGLLWGCPCTTLAHAHPWRIEFHAFHISIPRVWLNQSYTPILAGRAMFLAQGDVTWHCNRH